MSANQVVNYMVPTSRHETAPRPHLLELFSIFRRHLRSILMITIFGTALAAIVAAMIPAKYTAKAQVVVEPQPITRSGGAPALNSPVDQMAVDTQVTMLTAREFLRTVLTSLRQDEKSSKNTTIVKTKDSSARANQPSLSQTMTATKFEDFVQNLSVVQELRSRVITVRFTSTSPEYAAAVTNRTVRLYLENVENRKGAYLRDQLDRIRERIAQLSNVGATPKNASNEDAHDPDKNSRKPSPDINSQARADPQLLVVLHRRQQEIRDLLETLGPSVSILSLAMPPEKPSSLSPFLFILPVATLLFILATLLAIAKEQMDRSLRSERDINDALGIACIGHLPKLPNMGDVRPHTYLLQEPLSPYAKTIRSIVAELLWSSRRPTPKVVMVTSSVPMEGATALAISLATYAASLEKRVLLLDLDFLHASLTRELVAETKRGVIDLVLSDPPLDEIIKRHAKLGLDYLPMADESMDPLRLFAGDRLESILRELRNNYDLVIVDTPPILGSTGPTLLTSLVDKVLLVVKWGSTRRDVVQSALKELRSSNSSPQDIADTTSAIITQVSLKKHASYKFGDATEILAKYKDQ